MTDAAFWDKIAPRYAKSKIADPEAYEQSQARVRSYLKATDQVLELGCGTGSTALLLRDQVARYVASDISPGMIDIARAKECAADVDFRVAGTDAAAYADDRFDVVLGFNLLHLLPDLEGALRDVQKMLPEGGFFITKTPAIGEKWYFRPVIAVMRLIGKAPFVRMLKVVEIDRLIRDAGFEIVETGLYPPKTPSRFVVARKI